MGKDETLTGGGNGDLFLVGNSSSATVTTQGSSAVWGGTGNADIVTGASQTTVIGGSGELSITQGSGADVVFAGSGSETLDAGSGSGTIVLANGAAGGSLTIDDFHAGSVQVWLSGYSPSEQSNALAGASVTSAGTTLSISDGTRIILPGYTGSVGSLF